LWRPRPTQGCSAEKKKKKKKKKKKEEEEEEDVCASQLYEV